MNKTEDILSRLQRQCPEVDNPDDLTDRIMGHLPAMNEDHRRRQAVVKALRIISSVAALWLIGLFFYVNLPVADRQQHNNLDIRDYFSHLSSGSTLRNVYTGSLRQQSSTLVSYTQLKKKLYENK